LDGDPPGIPLFSVIILNWNGRRLLEECLDSVLEQTFRDFEVIVVDNGSTDGSVAWLEERWGDAVRTVALPDNRGFAGGNNAGIGIARGRFVVLLNNDTAVDPGWLSALSGATCRHPEAGMFTPKILNYDRRDEIDNTGHVIYPDGLARGRHRLEKDDGRFDEEGEALHPSGCAGVYRKEMLDAIGLLDETFFAYGEDVDLGLRARWAGWTCYYVPAAVVYHKYSATAGTYSPRKAFLVERNRIWILMKNFPVREIVLSPWSTGYRYLMHLKGAVSGQGASGRFAVQFSVRDLFLTVLRAECAALAGIPRVLLERRRLRKMRKLSAKEFRKLFRCFRLGAREAALKE
jgi:GT2 family glycosyltransferase